MLPFLLSIAVVLFWTLLGRAVLAVFKCRFGVLRSWLLAPTVGFSLQVVAAAFLNERGLPVDRFAWPLAAGLALFAAAVLAWRRPTVPGRALLPYGILSAAFLALVGSPMFRFGFDWISYVNDDFTNYCLSAERFRKFGFFHAPTLADLAGRDYGQYYFFMHALDLMRFGSEHTLALVGAVTGMNALRIFMPVILAMAVAQIAAAAGLVLHRGRNRGLALLTAVLLAASPLFMFGSLYQLIAQVGGLALMLAALALLTARPPGRSRPRLLARAVPAALTGAALALVYPEVSPFAILGFVLVVGIEWLRERRLPGARIVLLEYTLLLWAVFLRFNLVSYIYTLSNQFTSGFRHSDLALSLFPYFLIPSGLASIFGFQRENVQLPEPLGSVLILIGFFLLAAIALHAVVRAWRAVPMAVLLLVQVGLAVRLFQDRSDFGLYKLSMFIQPALAAGLAALIFLVARRTLARVVAAAVVVAMMVPTAYQYVSASFGIHANSFTEMQRASLNFERRPPPAPGARWDSGIDNVVAGKLAANLYRGTDLHFLARDFFHNSDFLPDANWPLMEAYPHPGLYRLGRELWTERNRDLFTDGELFGTEFSVQDSRLPPSAYLELPGRLSLFNKYGAKFGPGRLFELIPADEIRNRLVFVHSSLGNHYYLGDRRKISFTQQEEDPYRPGESLNGIGRFFLFRVERPTGAVYLRLSASKTLMGPDNKQWSPGAVVDAARRVPMGLVGSGAVNRIIGPFRPVHYEGAYYIALDFGQAPKPFPILRRGLAAWYNRSVPLDYRRLVGYGRDMSLLSAPQYAALRRPLRLERFPDGLFASAGLEYSGIYEDGWISPDAEFVFGSAGPAEAVRLRGFVPQASWEVQRQGALTVWVNGVQAAQVPAPVGDFDWVIPVARPAPDTHIRIHFSSYVTFPSPDSRQVAAKIRLLDVIPAPTRFDVGSLGAMRPPEAGIDADGWAQRRCAVWVPAPPSGRLALVLEYPGWPGVSGSELVRLSVGGGAPETAELRPGRNRIVVALPPGAGARCLRLDAAGGFRLPPPDGRDRAFRLVSIAAVAPGEK